jgi:hypothetical protein
MADKYIEYEKTSINVNKNIETINLQTRRDTL